MGFRDAGSHCDLAVSYSGPMTHTKSSRKSRRHHFTPVAYLQAWCSTADNKLWAHYRGRGGEVRRAKRAPKSIAFEFDLYAWRDEGGPGAKASELEEGFFGPLDDRAARALRQMRSETGNPLDPALKEAFAYFLNSLLEREPETVARAEDVARASVLAVIEEAKTRPDPYGTWARVLELFNAEAAAINAARRAMVARINDAPFVRWLCEQKWVVVNINGPALITSDRPLLVNLNGELPVYILRIAISPSRLLLIYPATWEVDDELLKMLMLGYNIQVAQNAWTVVVSEHELRGTEAAINYPRLLEASLRRRGDTPGPL